MRLVPYLYFKGNCEEALKFYEGCGLGKMAVLNRYAGTPMVERLGDEWAQKVLHSEFVGDTLRFYASEGPDSEPMKGSAMLLEFDEPATAALMFGNLSTGGQVTVPFAKQFWGDDYGNFTDAFGVQWATISRAS